MRPPVCEICDIDVDSADGGGLVTFQPDDRSREWRRRAESEVGLVGHPPDTGWFCAAHIEAARDAARTRSFGDGLRHLEAHARHIDVSTLTFADPDGLHVGIAIPARSPEGVRLVLQRRRTDLVAALGGGPTPVRSSSSFPLDGAHRRSVMHITVGRADVFDRVDYELVGGEPTALLVESRVVRDGALLALVRIGPFELLRSWVGDERLRAWVDAVAVDLALQPPDLLDPSPDLVGVDLGAGRLASSDGFELRWVEWDVAGVDAHELASSLREALPDFFAALGLEQPPVLETRTDRKWDPMDGAQPPYCPFTDTTLHKGVCADGTSVTVRVELVHWNDDDVANASVSLSIAGHESIGAFGSNGSGRAIGTLRLYRPTTAAVVDIVDRLVC